MEIFGGSRPKQAVYVQMRQVLRGKDGKLKAVKTKTVTIHNVTIEQVREILETGETLKRRRERVEQLEKDGRESGS